MLVFNYYIFSLYIMERKNKKKNSQRNNDRKEEL